MTASHDDLPVQAGPLARLAARPALSGWQRPARLAMALLSVALVWSVFARLDEVATAPGQVVPEGNVKVIQHLEGGIIREIHVQEGSEVKAGAPLIQLDLPVSESNREEMQVRLDGLMLSRARLQAELADPLPAVAALRFPEEEARRRPQLVEAERRMFENRRQERQSKLTVLTEQMRQRALEVQELETKQRSVASAQRLVGQKLDMSRNLLKDGLTSKMDHVQLEAEADGLNGQGESLRASMPRAQAALAEARERIQQESLHARGETQAQLADVELNIARVRELLTQATDQQLRTQITSPIDGVVKNMRYHTIGGVVRPGEPIMEIVPLHDKLQIEVRLPPSDRGYVAVGQPAVVKVTAYDFIRYGSLEGKVVQVAPDATTGQEGGPYFRVLVETARSYLGEQPGLYTITPGMQAQIDIHTGSRSVLQYLVQPVLKMRHEAFRER